MPAVTTSEKPAFSAAEIAGGSCWCPVPTDAQLQSSTTSLYKVTRESII